MLQKVAESCAKVHAAHLESKKPAKTTQARAIDCEPFELPIIKAFENAHLLISLSKIQQALCFNPFNVMVIHACKSLQAAICAVGCCAYH